MVKVLVTLINIVVLSVMTYRDILREMTRKQSTIHS